MGAPGSALRGLLPLTVAAVLWGTVPVATSLIYRLSPANPLSVAFFRLAFSLPILLPAALATTTRQEWRFSGRDKSFLLLFGTAVALYQVCYFAAIPLVGVTVAALITLCTAPVIVAVLSTIWLREPPERRVLLAMAAAITGTFLLVGAGGEAQSFSPAGIPLALGAAFSFAVVTLSSRALAGRRRALHSTAVGMVIGAALLLPFMLLTEPTLDFLPEGWLLLLHLGLVPTALSYLLFFYGLHFTTATVASVVNLLEPLTSAMLAWLLLQ